MVAVPHLDLPTIAIVGSDRRFPVRRIYCVGQNYADHAREMGADPAREQPFFFTKPADAVVASGATLPFPTRTQNLHHEVELVVALSRGGENIAIEDAPDLIFGHAVGLDLTRRDLQAAARQAGRPWDMAKGFDRSAPLAPLTLGVPPANGSISLTVEGEIRQSGDLDQMIWNVAEVIAVLSTYVSLSSGDLIFTGTPSGVGPIRPGESVRGVIADLPPIEIRFTA